MVEKLCFNAFELLLQRHVSMLAAERSPTYTARRMSTAAVYHICVLLPPAAAAVNPPGFYYSAATAAAVQCPPNTYSTGFGWQSSCASCPGGLVTLPADIGPYTSAAACSELP